MVIISPEQKIFTQIRMVCVQLFGEENVFDYLPGEVPYPFVFIGEQFKQDERRNMDKLDKRTQVTIHVYHDDYKKRGDLSLMLYKIELSVRSLYGHKGEITTLQILPDNSTNQNLLHGILETNIQY